ncbi:protein NLRC5-like [Dendronephthya gigantea]|uniref:protein NLRC5-like n=1 Tax=Dendronephthya gigantea TaxID=151771 RepID=UPI00106CD6B6|nr:protein NLRC5-like [Dendronephthya gigantea]
MKTGVPQLGKLIPRKSFNTYNIVLLTLFTLFNLVVIIILGAALDFDSKFHCYNVKLTSKLENETLLGNCKMKCSVHYKERFQFSVPMSRICIVRLMTVLVFSIIYAYLVKRRVERFDSPPTDTSSSNDSEENHAMLSTLSYIHLNPESFSVDCRIRVSTLWIYIAHLFIARIIPLLTFVIFVFYQADIPENFLCPWPNEMPKKVTSSFNYTNNSRYNVTTVYCINPNASRSKTIVITVAIADVVLVILTFLELGYLAWIIYNDRDLMSDREFCTVYLLRKRKRIRKFVNKVRERFSEETFQLNDDFGDLANSFRNFKDIYVNVVIQEGREQINAYPHVFDRKKICNCHFEIPSLVTKLTSTIEIFKPLKICQNQTYPRSILVIGRPGIGKTMLTKKLLHQWKENKEQFWRDKIIIVIRLRLLINNKTISLREMLGYGEGLSYSTFQTVYDFILSNPTNIILVFDGLDELVVDRELLCTKKKTVNSLIDKMPVFSILEKLVHGKLLKGVTILITSRPSAEPIYAYLGFENIVEILGFSREQIKKYVIKFCENDKDTGELIWNQIQESAELLSFCYIPVNSYIVCLTLKESIQFDINEGLHHKGFRMNIPKTITELYKRAVKVLMYRHNPKFKLLPRPNDYLDYPLPEELDKDLMKITQVAMDAMKNESSIFERTGDEFGELANCGLFNKLPDSRNFFCFLHLTLQEFLAASKVVTDDMRNVEVFLETHFRDPKWHLVIQFVAGLIGDKIKTAKMTGKSDLNYSWEKKTSGIIKRFEEWVLQLGTDNEIALLGIKCFYELQDDDIIKAVSGNYLAERNGELCLKDINITPANSAAVFEFLGCSKELKRLRFHDNCQIRGEYSYREMGKLFSTEGNNITSFHWKS